MYLLYWAILSQPTEHEWQIPLQERILNSKIPQQWKRGKFDSFYSCMVIIIVASPHLQVSLFLPHHKIDTLGRNNPAITLTQGARLCTGADPQALLCDCCMIVVRTGQIDETFPHGDKYNIINYWSKPNTCQKSQHQTDWVTPCCTCVGQIAMQWKIIHM